MLQQPTILSVRYYKFWAQGGAHKNAAAASGEAYFAPTFGKHSVSDARLHVTGVEGPDPIRAALVVSLDLKTRCRDVLARRYDSYEGASVSDR